MLIYILLFYDIFDTSSTIYAIYMSNSRDVDVCYSSINPIHEGNSIYSSCIPIRIRNK